MRRRASRLCTARKTASTQPHNLNPQAVVALGLLAWIVAGFALARSAEAQVAIAAPPAPWPAATIALALAGFALSTRPLAEAAACAIACIALVAAAGPDSRTGYLFDRVTLPAAGLVAAVSIVSGRSGEAALGVLLLVCAFGALVAYSRGRCMGLGDVKAMYVLGAAFGPLESLVAIFAACLSGVLTAAVRRTLCRGTELPFGPHLAVGAAFALVLGGPIVHRVMGL